MALIDTTVIRSVTEPSGYRTSDMYEVTGRKIDRLFISNDQSLLEIHTGDGPLYYEAEGDCCSESWFADIIGVNALLGGTCRLVEEIEIHNYNLNDGRCRQEEDQVYGYRITTDKGRASVIFRNSSNGYYGGCLILRTDPHTLPMTEITDDWSA